MLLGTNNNNVKYLPIGSSSLTAGTHVTVAIRATTKITTLYIMLKGCSALKSF